MIMLAPYGSCAYYAGLSVIFYNLIPFSMIDSNYLSNYKEVYTKYSDIVKSIDNNIKVKELNNAS